MPKIWQKWRKALFNFAFLKIIHFSTALPKPRFRVPDHSLIRAIISFLCAVNGEKKFLYIAVGFHIILLFMVLSGSIHVVCKRIVKIGVCIKSYRFCYQKCNFEWNLQSFLQLLVVQLFQIIPREQSLNLKNIYICIF